MTWWLIAIVMTWTYVASTLTPANTAELKTLDFDICCASAMKLRLADAVKNDNLAPPARSDEENTWTKRVRDDSAGSDNAYDGEQAKQAREPHSTGDSTDNVEIDSENLANSDDHVPQTPTTALQRFRSPLMENPEIWLQAKKRDQESEHEKWRRDDAGCDNKQDDLCIANIGAERVRRSIVRAIGPHASEDNVTPQHLDQPERSASGPPVARSFAPELMQMPRAEQTNVHSSFSPPVNFEAGVKAENQKNASLRPQSGNFSAMLSQLSCEYDSELSQGVPPRVLAQKVTENGDLALKKIRTALRDSNRSARLLGSVTRVHTYTILVLPTASARRQVETSDNDACGFHQRDLCDSRQPQPLECEC